MKKAMETKLKKTMTKKAYKELQKRSRSVVGRGMNLGTRTMHSNKDLSREKRAVAAMLRSGSWESTTPTYG